MARQDYRALLARPPVADLATVSPSTTEVALVPVSTGSKLSIPANTFEPNQGVKIYAAGTVVTGATAINWTLTPRWGTSNAGVTLGASTAVAKTASVTVPWVLQAFARFRTVRDDAATQSTLLLHGTFESAGAARDIVFGGTLGTVDTTSAQGFWFGIVASGADVSATFTPKDVWVETVG
jgi:hypothetical protein